MLQRITNDSLSPEGAASSGGPAGNLKSLCWIEIPVSDVKAAATRLNTLFNWRVQSPHTSAFALLVTGESMPVGVSLVLRESAPGATDEPMTTLLGVNVAPNPIEQVFADALKIGFMPVEPPHAVPEAGHGMRAVIRDPDGNLFGLWRD